MEAPLAILLWTTAALSLMGLVSTAVVAVRKDGRAAILLLPFGGVLLHQTPMLLGTPQMGLALDTQTLQAGALLLVALGSFATLLGLSRIAGERNSAEELHWDAMEVIRASNELARPGHEEAGLAELLAIGARHFEMGFGAILPPNGGEPHGVYATPTGASVASSVGGTSRGSHAIT